MFRCGALRRLSILVDARFCVSVSIDALIFLSISVDALRRLSILVDALLCVSISIDALTFLSISVDALRRLIGATGLDHGLLVKSLHTIRFAWTAPRQALHAKTSTFDGNPPQTGGKTWSLIRRSAVRRCPHRPTARVACS